MTFSLVVLTCLVIFIAIVFDFVNGFHDASNSIATVVATRVLSPRRAVLWAATFNFIAVFIFDTGVAKTVGSGMIDLQFVTLPVILAGLTGATTWGLITWWKRLPTSSSHALIGGYAGAAITHHALQKGWSEGFNVVIASGWSKTLLFIVLAPTLGLLLGGALMKLVQGMTKYFALSHSDKWFGRLQLVSSAFLSLTHGGNDAQKTAGIVTSALVTAGFLDQFAIPHWVLFISYGTIALGTFFGGWRIVETMGNKLTRLKPNSGFCAESAAATSILLATMLKLPVSTTHVTTGSILGTGFVRNRRSVRWGLARNIFVAWLLTIPVAAFIGGFLMLLITAMGCF